MYDIIVIGGGVSGLMAALYACRASKSVLVIEKETFGGQITYSPKVENIPGFIQISGNEYAEKLVEQALEQGAEMESAVVTEIRDGGDTKTVVTDAGEFVARAVIIATGARHRTLGLEGEDALIGDGISFCAVCDGAFYGGQTVAVIGGGNSALQEALLLSETVKKLYVIQDLDYLTGEAKLAEQLKTKENAEIICGAHLEEYLSDENGITGIKIKLSGGEEREIAVNGVFLAIGLIPQNEPFENVLELTERGYADSGEDCRTKTEGVFVAGDCRNKRIRQVTTAAADGAVAALAACEYIDR
ncbi:MAG: FAD-dependent oxidoreductase [Clostridia bacterium]|nr:FAD-dependent oxidoreductase [Clostridia bacterium]